MPESTRFDQLTEIHNIACAAAHALRCIDGHLSMHCDVDGFTYEDAAGCVYTIKRAIFMLNEITRSQGLKSDPLYPEWGLSIQELERLQELEDGRGLHTAA